MFAAVRVSACACVLFCVLDLRSQSLVADNLSRGVCVCVLRACVHVLFFVLAEALTLVWPNVPPLASPPLIGVYARYAIRLVSGGNKQRWI